MEKKIFPLPFSHISCLCKEWEATYHQQNKNKWTFEMTRTEKSSQYWSLLRNFNCILNLTYNKNCLTHLPLELLTSSYIYLTEKCKEPLYLKLHVALTPVSLLMRMSTQGQPLDKTWCFLCSLFKTVKEKWHLFLSFLHHLFLFILEEVTTFFWMAKCNIL